MDTGFSFVSDFTISGYSSKLDQLSYGSFEHMPLFTASNGVKVEYYLYLPDYGEDVEGLPVHMYLHGFNENGDLVLSCGLPQLINDQVLTPEGICICIQGHRNFDNPNYQESLIELVDHVVDEYNADKNKVSLSGHSWGAMTGYYF